MLTGLDLLQETLGVANNFVGMDPRSVNNSGPDVSCFPGVKETATLYDEDWGKAVDANSTSGLLEAWARAGAFGDWCSAVHGPNSTAKYANTVATATDMLHYAELLAESNGSNKEDAQVWYYGASYGTVLGSTFAALFPNRVGRLILDGVVDVQDYYEGKWESNLEDADAAVESFFKYCYEGGEEACVFWEDSPEAIKDRFYAVIDDLEKNPVIVTNTSVVEFPTIVTITDFYSALVSVPYSPSVYFPYLAQILLELEKGDGSTLAAFSGEGARIDQCSNETNVNVGQIEPRYYIACNDANNRFNLSTFDAWKDHVDLLVDESKLLGESWAAGTSVNCRNLYVDTPKSQIFTGTPSANSTSTPILFIGNTLDPVTPLSAAKKMTARFGGARLLQQNSVGHASVSAASKCTAETVQKYLADATLPEEGTICEAEEVPFKTTPNEKRDGARKALRKRHHV